jgi:fucose 4-O-acetylase-like acetyltransferase
VTARRYSVLVTTAHSLRSGVDLGNRDLTLDLARVFCVLLVVVIHLLFVGVGSDADGDMAITRPLEEQPWFWAATWAGQIMPLFFVVGGFATATSLRSHRRRAAAAGGIRDEADRAFVHARIQRLARPALPLFVFLAVVLGAATALGIDAGLLDAVATGVGSPLWFLCAYLICQLAAPALLDRHERAPVATVLALLAAVILIDVAQFSMPAIPTDAAGMSMLGYLNLLFVWPLVQQFGFWYADGWFARRAWWQLLLIAALCWAALVPLTVWGPYSDDMLTNLNPPTLPLVALGLGQAALLQLLKPPLTALMRTRAMRAIVFVIGSRLMTVYLWHLPLILAIAGLGLVVPVIATAPGSAAWWLTRPIVYLVVLGLVFVLSLALGRFERPNPVRRVASRAELAVGAVATIAPTAAITMLGLDLWLAVAGAIGFALAVGLLGAGQKPKSPTSAAPNSPKSEPKAPNSESAADASTASAPSPAPSPDAAAS